MKSNTCLALVASQCRWLPSGCPSLQLPRTRSQTPCRRCIHPSKTISYLHSIFIYDIIRCRSWGSPKLFVVTNIKRREPKLECCCINFSRCSMWSLQLCIIRLRSARFAFPHTSHWTEGKLVGNTTVILGRKGILRKIFVFFPVFKLEIVTGFMQACMHSEGHLYSSWHIFFTNQSAASVISTVGRSLPLKNLDTKNDF